MERTTQGHFITISRTDEVVQAFIPSPLPPEPRIEWTDELHAKFDNAILALGRLDSISTLLPDTAMFLFMYVRKEALLSSMIEGTQSSLSDLLAYEEDLPTSVPIDDVAEVSNYVAAMEHGIARIRDGFPLSLRLLREMHSVLLRSGRGDKQTPGEFRTSQNWIGGTRPGNAHYVPPPAENVLDCMGALELFLHDQPRPTSPLLKAALAHVQFETIHPFLDGNGRLGRLLITLILCEQRVIREPLLYLSLYFKTHRSEYYELLTKVRATGDWEAWLYFFAEAVENTATQAVETTRELLKLADDDGKRIRELGRPGITALHVHGELVRKPLSTPVSLSRRTGLSLATVNSSLEKLSGMGIVREITERKRNRLFCYTQFMSIMNRGTDAL